MKIKLLIFLLINFAIESSNLLKFNKIVLWGHKLHSHTHSYIHWGFFRAFKHLGYEVLWLDKNDKVNNINFENSLFITESQADENIPLRQDCFYILHNCTSLKYKQLIDSKKAITLQVYTHDCIPRKLTKMEPFILYNVEEQIIYMPWATDLLPHEINEIKKNLRFANKKKESYFIGTVGAGTFGNINQINPFIKACKENGISFKTGISKSLEDNIYFIQNSFMAPAIQGEWQCKNGYIPCRIFKNISYGQFGITNSETVYNLFDKKIVYNSDTYQLFYDAQKKIKNLTLNELYELMDFVRDKHTYLNRINCLFKFIKMVKN